MQILRLPPKQEFVRSCFFDGLWTFDNAFMMSYVLGEVSGKGSYTVKPAVQDVSPSPHICQTNTGSYFRTLMAVVSKLAQFSTKNKPLN